MDSLRVDICYRPLRIGWAVCAGDFEALRYAVRCSFALWGGRFNPVLVVDQEEMAESLIDVFRVDMIMPISDSPKTKSFAERFRHLPRPFFERGLFVDYGDRGPRSHVLDVHNAFVHVQKQPEWEMLEKRGVRLYSWSSDDPLADVFLMYFGQYPSAAEVRTDYTSLLKQATKTTEVILEANSKLTKNLFEYPSISALSRYGLKRHYSINQFGWDSPGFYRGDAKNFDDLVCYWNLRAADIPLWFVDPAYLDRYGETIEVWKKIVREMVVHRRFQPDRGIGVWLRHKALDLEHEVESLREAVKPFGEEPITAGIIRDDSLGGVLAPMMYLGEVSALGVMSTGPGRPKVSFALDDKPFCSDTWFYTQHLVASLSFLGGLYGDEQHVLTPPFIPELNEFYARLQIVDFLKLRIESDRVGVVIDAADKSCSISALPVADLFERIFELAGFTSKISAGGLIARQLIAQFEGVDGARAFKIPGVRRLLRTHGPTATFIKKGALQLIGGRDPDNPDAKFKDFEDLYIEPRPRGTKLEPEAVFTHLVEKGLFRMGAGLKCPHCRMDSWTALDVLRQKIVCELCGREFDATRQLVTGIWHYRRSGVLGAEKNAQGAVPVVLTLQQFQANTMGWSDHVYSTSLELEPKAGVNLPKCEIDFAWLIRRHYPERTDIIIGECKDRGGDKGTFDQNDIDHLRAVANALPYKRFNAFIVLSKLSPFTPNEIALAKTLNGQYQRRVILLTAMELEPNHFYERTKLKFKDIKDYASTPEDLANTTYQIYFREHLKKVPDTADASIAATIIAGLQRLRAFLEAKLDKER